MRMEAIAYKEFFIVVKARREYTTKNKFHVIGQIYRNLKETPVMRNWLPVQEFASEKAACEFGLQEARAWIDEDEAAAG